MRSDARWGARAWLAWPYSRVRSGARMRVGRALTYVLTRGLAGLFSGALSGVLTGALLLAPPSAVAAQCRLVEMNISGNTARSGDVVIDLGNGATLNPESRDVYEGPPRIRVGNARACRASEDVSIIFGKLWLGAGKVVYISTYSGSEDMAFALDARSCRILWRSPQFEGPPAVYHPRTGTLTMGALKPAIYRVRLGDGCLPESVATHKRRAGRGHRQRK